jgi:hypothetical protein
MEASASQQRKIDSGRREKRGRRGRGKERKERRGRETNIFSEFEFDALFGVRRQIHGDHLKRNRT